MDISVAVRGRTLKRQPVGHRTIREISKDALPRAAKTKVAATEIKPAARRSRLDTQTVVAVVPEQVGVVLRVDARRPCEDDRTGSEGSRGARTTVGDAQRARHSNCALRSRRRREASGTEANRRDSRAGERRPSGGRTGVTDKHLTGGASSRSADCRGAVAQQHAVGSESRSARATFANSKVSAEGKRRQVSDRIDDVGAVVVDPHGLTGRDCDPGASGVLDGDRAVRAVVDDVRLLNSRDDEVVARSRSARQVKAHITRSLRGVGIGQCQRDVGVRESDIRRTDNSLFQRRTEVDVSDVAPRGVVLTRGHQLDFDVAISARHLRSLRRYLYPNDGVAVSYLYPITSLRIVNGLPVRCL